MTFGYILVALEAQAEVTHRAQEAHTGDFLLLSAFLRRCFNLYPDKGGYSTFYLVVGCPSSSAMMKLNFVAK